jgi:hypothetical protein
MVLAQVSGRNTCMVLAQVTGRNTKVKRQLDTPAGSKHRMFLQNARENHPFHGALHLFTKLYAECTTAIAAWLRRNAGRDGVSTAHVDCACRLRRVLFSTHLTTFDTKVGIIDWNGCTKALTSPDSRDIRSPVRVPSKYLVCSFDGDKWHRFPKCRAQTQSKRLP